MDKMSTPSFSGIKPPARLTFTKSIREDWKIFKREWNDYSIIQNVAERPENFQVALFRTAIGPEAMKIIETLETPTGSEPENIKTLIQMMDTFVLGQINPTYERYLFRKRTQRSGELMDDFVTDIKTMIKTCEVPDNFKDEFVKDQIIFGIIDNALRERLLQEKSLNISKCLEICLASEAASSHVKTITVDAMVGDNIYFVRKPKSQAPKVAKYSTTPARHKSLPCKFCGYNHPLVKSKCPAWGKTCNLCHDQNHFSKMCVRRQPRSKVRTVTDLPKTEAASDSDECIGVIHTPLPEKIKDCRARLLIHGKPVDFLLDTGATTNIIPEKYIDLTKLEIGPTKPLSMWNNTCITSSGSVTLNVFNPATHKRHRIQFDLVKQNLKPVIGLSEILRLNLMSINLDNFDRVLALNEPEMTRNDLNKRFPKVFQGDIGTFEGTAHLTVDETIQPTTMPSRRIPFALKSKIPVTTRKLQPAVVKPDPIKVEKRDTRIQNNYNSHAKDLKSLNVGDTVRIKPVIKHKQPWEKGTVVKRLDNRSYEVQPVSGNITRRNRVHLRPAENPKTIPEPAVNTREQSNSHTVKTKSGRIVKPVERYGCASVKFLTIMDDFSSPPRKKKNRLSKEEKLFERELELVMDISKQEVASQPLSLNQLPEEQNTSILNITDCEDLRLTTPDNKCSETVVCEVYEQGAAVDSSASVTSPTIKQSGNPVGAKAVANRQAKTNKKHIDRDSDESYEESGESEDDFSPESDDDSDFDASEKGKKTKKKTLKNTKTPPSKPQAKTTTSGSTKNSGRSKVGATSKAVAKDTASVRTTVPARNIPKPFLTPTQRSAPVSVSRKAWTPPARAGDSSDCIRSPSTGLRLGLSKKARIKPLHSSVKVTH